MVFIFIIKQIKDRIYFSISVDFTADGSHTDKLTIIVRFVLYSGPIERFLKFPPLTSNKVKDMVDLVLKVLNKNNINVINCKGQSYDNASNVNGT